MKNKFIAIFWVQFLCLNFSFGQSNFQQAQSYLERLESEYTYWEEGYDAYRSFRHLANHFVENKIDSAEVRSFINKINSAAYLKIDALAKKLNVSEDYASFRSINIFNLYKMTDEYQEKTIHKVDSLKLLIKKEVNNEKKVFYYDSLIDISYYYFKYDKFREREVNRFEKERALINIEIGSTSLGCQQLYDASISTFFTGYSSGVCEKWYKVKSAAETEKYEEQQKANAKKWYSNNPNLIKLRSLIGESFTTVKAYLGKPLLENYKLDAGVGVHSQQFIGNKYKNEQGVYEVGFKNGNVMIIQFYPNKYIKYSPEKFDNENSMFDMEGGIDGVCSGETKNNHIGDIKIFSIDYDCSSSGLVSTVFYGRNGKLLSVLAY